MSRTLRYSFALGLRGLLRQPRTMVLSVLLLALGLAAVMSMLTLLSMLSATPLPGVGERLHLAWVDSRRAPQSDRSAVEETPPFLWKLEDAEAMAALQPQIRQTALVSTLLTVHAPDGDAARSGLAVLASGPMPAMFGVPLLRGRHWSDAEAHARVAVISEDTARALFGDTDPLGRDVRIGAGQFRVIGIAGEWAPQPRFHFFQTGTPAWGDARETVFLPLRAALDADIAPVATRDCDSRGMGGFGFDTIDLQDCRWLAVWAELPDAATRTAYAAALDGYARARQAAGVFERDTDSRLYSVDAWLAANHVVPDAVRLNLLLAVGLLALCMVNVAGLLAARFLRRGGELGVRRVLGAPRGSVMVQCLVEAGAAGALGGLLALPLTAFGLWLIRLQDHGYTDLARFEPRLFLLLLVLSVATGLLVGVVPALRAARIEPVLQVKTL